MTEEMSGLRRSARSWRRDVPAFREPQLARHFVSAEGIAKPRDKFSSPCPSGVILQIRPLLPCDRRSRAYSFGPVSADKW